MSTQANSAPILRGLTTVAYSASDLAAAKSWYGDLLGMAPYFDTPAYVEFRLGDYQHELGIIDSKFLPDLGGDVGAAKTPSGAIVYWHVDDVPAMLDRLVSLGAKPHQPPRDFGAGFIGASVIDPFGNVLGVMYNPHYLEVLAGVKG